MCPSRARRRQCLSSFLCLLLTGLAAPTGGAPGDEADLVRRMQVGGHVLLIRHAEAPGTGDPAGFRLDDCSTQRNLSDTGREQARAMGEWLRARGIVGVRVYSSQWCRCLETAERLGLGPLSELPALNSFYERPQDREPNLAALMDFLAAQPPHGQLLVLVTHQVTISALSGAFVAPGQAVLMAVGEGGVPRAVGRLNFAE